MDVVTFYSSGRHQWKANINLSGFILTILKMWTDAYLKHISIIYSIIGSVCHLLFANIRTRSILPRFSSWEDKYYFSHCFTEVTLQSPNKHTLTSGQSHGRGGHIAGFCVNAAEKDAWSRSPWPLYLCLRSSAQQLAKQTNRPDTLYTSMSPALAPCALLLNGGYTPTAQRLKARHVLNTAK